MSPLTSKKVFIAAEISANHGQDLKRALKMIRIAKECGADAVKFQAYTPDTLTLDVDNKYFRITGHPKWGGQTLYQLYQKAFTPWEWFPKLKAAAENIGLAFFSTAFDQSSVDFLEKIGVFCHKIASFELVDLPLIRYAARTRKPLILSTGMAKMDELCESVTAARRAGARNLLLLKCVSCYPADPQEMHLSTIPDMKQRFHLPVGISDHTLGTEISSAAVALGACFVEKHFTLSRKIQTPDSFFSLEPSEFKRLVDHVRVVEQALGRVHYGPTPKEAKSLKFRRSLFVASDIKKGERLTNKNIRSVRPADGMPPKFLSSVIGQKAKAYLRKGTPLKRFHY